LQALKSGPYSKKSMATTKQKTQAAIICQGGAILPDPKKINGMN